MVDVDRFGECWDDVTPHRLGEEVDPDGVEVLHVLRHEQPGHYLVHEGEGQVPENESHNQHLRKRQLSGVKYWKSVGKVFFLGGL